jgi:hypothetical protein
MINYLSVASLTVYNVNEAVNSSFVGFIYGCILFIIGIIYIGLHFGCVFNILDYIFREEANRIR